MSEKMADYAMMDEKAKEEYLEGLLARDEERVLNDSLIVRKLGRDCTSIIKYTVRNAVEETQTLPERAGYAILMFGAKTDFGGTAKTFDAVPDCARGFCESVLGFPPGVISMKLEAYLLSGGEAAVAARAPTSEELRTKIVAALQRSISKLPFPPFSY